MLWEGGECTELVRRGGNLLLEMISIVETDIIN